MSFWAKVYVQVFYLKPRVATMFLAHEVTICWSPAGGVFWGEGDSSGT